MFCTKCGRQIPDGARFCTGCGNKLDPPGQMPNPAIPPEQMPKPAIPPGQMTGQAVQPEIPRQQNFTGNQPGYDGRGQGFKPLEPEDFAVRKPEKKKNKTLLIVLIITIVVLMALAGVLLFFILGKDSGSTRKDRDKDRHDTVVEAEDEKDEDDSKPGGEIVTVPATTAPATTARVTTVVTTTEALDNYDSISKFAAKKKPISVNYVSADVSDYPNVKVYFTAEDELGDTVYLSSPNVAVKETVTGGKELEQTVKSIDQLKGREGISISLVADKSGSMEYDLTTMQNIMTQFVNALDYKLGDRAELIAFDSYVMYMCTYTNDPVLLKNGITNMSPYGSTALYDALYDAVTDAGMQKGARCVIAFTDGLENCSVHTADEVIRLADQLSVPIFIIGTVGANTDYENIAISTGGDYWNISGISDMQTVLDQIYAAEKDMYCLEYTSDSKADPLAERSLSIAVADETYGSVTEMVFTPTEEKKTAQHTSRYELIKDDISWAEANAECIRRGGHLITITSEEELKIATDLADKEGLKYIWMGGYTSVRGSSVYGHWITGEDFAYQKWYPDEPSRNDVDGTPEMYLMLWNVNKEGWTWNDQRDDLFTKELAHIFTGKTGYICEYEE
ncbi:MAG: VWA domain-containing protein [Ruminococcus sp.]|nr:VWA domain-containing protein [Ruminococcus sp.]